MEDDGTDPFGSNIIARLCRDAAHHAPRADAFSTFHLALLRDHEEREEQRKAPAR